MRYEQIILRIPVEDEGQDPAAWDWQTLLDTPHPVYVEGLRGDGEYNDGAKYANDDLAERLLNNVGQEVEIVTYAQPGGEIRNIALENVETSTVILDFDL